MKRTIQRNMNSTILWVTLGQYQYLLRIHLSTALEKKKFKHFVFYKYFCLVIQNFKKKQQSSPLGENPIFSFFTTSKLLWQFCWTGLYWFMACLGKATCTVRKESNVPIRSWTYISWFTYKKVEQSIIYSFMLLLFYLSSALYNIIMFYKLDYCLTTSLVFHCLLTPYYHPEAELIFLPWQKLIWLFRF